MQIKLLFHLGLILLQCQSHLVLSLLDQFPYEFQFNFLGHVGILLCGFSYLWSLHGNVNYLLIIIFQEMFKSGVKCMKIPIFCFRITEYILQVFHKFEVKIFVASILNLIMNYIRLLKIVDTKEKFDTELETFFTIIRCFSHQQII